MSTTDSRNWKDALLFSSLRVGPLTLRNRIVMPPMKTNMDLAGEQARAYYRERARGGAALVIVEATPLTDFDAAGFGDGLRALADAIHAEGAAAAIQLFHTGLVGGERIEASPTQGARAATKEELAAIPQQFARAAALARQAGFDGAEVHGAHGFFLNRFFSPQHNRRDDEYGGAPERRARLGLECARAVRALASDFLLLYRHTAQADYPLDDSRAFAPKLQRAGVDIIDISPSSSEGGDHADLAAAVKSQVSCPVIAVGGMEDPAAAEAVLRTGKADLVAIGRALIADPHLPRKVLAGRADQITACTKCNEKCFGNLEAGIPITCSQNPDAGLEYRLDA